MLMLKVVVLDIVLVSVLHDGDAVDVDAAVFVVGVYVVNSLFVGGDAVDCDGGGGVGDVDIIDAVGGAVNSDVVVMLLILMLLMLIMSVMLM